MKKLLGGALMTGAVMLLIMSVIHALYLGPYLALMCITIYRLYFRAPDVAVRVVYSAAVIGGGVMMWQFFSAFWGDRPALALFGAWFLFDGIAVFF